MEEAVTDKSGTTRYSLGSVLNHVLLHQTVVGQEAKKQLAKLGEKNVDVVIGCAGGGSNFAGLLAPRAVHQLECFAAGGELPGSRVVECWSETLPVLDYLQANYSPEQVSSIFAPRPGRLAGILEIVRRVQAAQPEG